jgi:hypothetical protein
MEQLSSESMLVLVLVMSYILSAKDITPATWVNLLVLVLAAVWSAI